MISSLLPDEPFRRSLDRRRAIAIALNAANAQVDLQNPLEIMPLSVLPGSQGAQLLVSSVGDGHLIVTAFRDSQSNRMITIPCALIDEVWTTVDHRLALILGVSGTRQPGA